MANKIDFQPIDFQADNNIDFQPIDFQESKSESPGFFSRMNEHLVERGANIADELTPKGQESIGKTLQAMPQRALRVTGQAAGLITDTGAEALKGIYTTVAPKSFQNAVSASIQHAISEDKAFAEIQKQKGIAGARPFAQGVSEDLGSLKQKYPEHYKNVAAIGNIASVALASKPAAELELSTKEAISKTAKGIGKIFEKSPEVIDKKLKSSIREGIEKSIRPGVEGKRTFGAAEKYYKNAQNAVENIVLNKNNLRLTDDAGEVIEGLPKNLKQFSQAVSQTKQEIYKEFDAMAKESRKAGASVDLNPIAGELNNIAASPVIQDNAPQIAEYVKRLSETYKKRGSYSTVQAQEAITHFNNSLEAFYKNPSYDTASKAYIDSLVANHLRKYLDSAIESSTGPGYQKLKNAYGSLKAIERDVNRRSIVDARKNIKGLIDFTDIFSGSQAVNGILSMNPAMVGEAAAAKGIARLYKILNDPNRVVKSMFEKTEQLLKKRGSLGGKPLVDVIKKVEKQTANAQKKETLEQALKEQSGTSIPVAIQATRNKKG